jgi:hypothetical protein
VRTGYVEASAGLNSIIGPWARLESGARFSPSLGAFAFGEVRRGEKGAGLGLRYTFGW